MLCQNNKNWWFKIKDLDENLKFNINDFNNIEPINQKAVDNILMLWNKKFNFEADVKENLTQSNLTNITANIDDSISVVDSDYYFKSEIEKLISHFEKEWLEADIKFSESELSTAPSSIKGTPTPVFFKATVNAIFRRKK